jgi:hypothetical protein
MRKRQAQLNEQLRSGIWRERGFREEDKAAKLDLTTSTENGINRATAAQDAGRVHNPGITK